VAAIARLRQQFDRTIQSDVEDTVRARDGFELAVVAYVRAEAADVDDNFLARRGVRAEFARQAPAASARWPVSACFDGHFPWAMRRAWFGLFLFHVSPSCT